MSPPLPGVAEEGESNVAVLVSFAFTDGLSPNTSLLRGCNYLGFSDSSVVKTSAIFISDESKASMNLRATELRLGLPGSQSPERDMSLNLSTCSQLDERPFFPLHPSSDGHCSSAQRNIVSGNKRGFSDAIEVELSSDSDVNVTLSSKPSADLRLKAGTAPENLSDQPNKVKEIAVQKSSQVANEARSSLNGSRNNNSSAPATKAQVVGWPPIRSFRKNSLASTSKNTDEVDGKVGAAALYVKVSMDGAPYLRKVDLKNYAKYPDLSSALEKMFSCFTIGQYGSHGVPGREMMSESKLKDMLHGSEYVLTYEDKDGDWMLVGDVPWEMFIHTCKRLRIMKSSDAIGLAPRAMEKCKNRN